jgi:hypothetical protein
VTAGAGSPKNSFGIACLVPLVIIVVGSFLGGLVGCQIAEMESYGFFETWHYLGIPPGGGEKIVGANQWFLEVQTGTLARYTYKVFKCGDYFSEFCWQVTLSGEDSRLKIHDPDPSCGKFIVANPPTEVIEQVKVVQCYGYMGMEQTHYVLGKDGSVWVWNHSISDLRGLLGINYMSKGLVIGFVVSFVIAGIYMAIIVQ